MSENNYDQIKGGISVVVAAKNEEDHLFNTVCNIIEGVQRAQFQQPYEIIIFDDGSTDKTNEIANDLAAKLSFVRVIRNETSKGLAALYIHAINVAKYGRLTFFSGDNNCHSYLSEVLFRNWDKADIVVSYFVNVEDRSQFRIVVSAFFTFIYNSFFCTHVKYINGNSIYPIKLLRELNLKDNGYGIFAEVLVKALRKGVTFYEVAGYTNPDLMNSQALSLRNLGKVVFGFLRLVWIVYVSEKDKYCYKPRRAHVPQFEEHKELPKQV